MTTTERRNGPTDFRGWASTARGLAALLAVLAVPFLLRPRDNLYERGAESIVIITPHSEPLRYEFARGFREHMRQKGRSVSIDWRTPGSSRDIARLIVSEYTSAFASHWTHRLKRPWSARVAAAFADPSVKADAGSATDDGVEARRAFLDSDVGIGIDLLFGAGSVEAAANASAGRFVDAGLVRARRDLFGERGIPQTAGGKVMWDTDGRWVGTCLTLFGICHNRDSIARLGVENAPEQWSDLADPRYFGQLSIADPSKTGSAASAFEMVIHQQMNLRAEELRREGAGATAPDIESRAQREGWERAMRLVRRIAANARYFASLGTQPTLDIATGDAAAGMCIDFYGRFQSETPGGGKGRLGLVTPRGGTAVDTDPIGLFRGAPHRELAIAFIEFVLSPDGQKLWNFRVGTPGGPRRYALRRLPILPELYAPAFEALRSDPGENPYDEARAFTYHPAWTGPLLRAITFIVRTTCIDAHTELSEAYRALFRAGFPPRATALFDDVGTIDYAAATGPIQRAVSSGNPVDEAALGNRLIDDVRAQYRRAAELARSGQ